MVEQTMMNRQVSTTFCDDIRQEIGGKLSYMGVYSSDLCVGGFPITLPKFCVAIRVMTPADQPFWAIKFRLFRDAEMLAEAEMVEPQFEANPGDLDGVPESDRKDMLMTVQGMLVLAPLVLEAPCIFRVRVVTESEELRGPGLRILLAPQQPVQVPALQA